MSLDNNIIQIIDDSTNLTITDSENNVTSLVISSENVEVIEIGIMGERGADGTGDLSYVHNQIQASDTWNITHNLNKYPSVMIIDSGGSAVVGEITYNTLNQITLNFSCLFSGQAFLN